MRWRFAWAWTVGVVLAAGLAMPAAAQITVPLSCCTAQGGGAVTGTADRCARFDATGTLVAASADCASGDTTSTPAGFGSELQFRSSGSAFGAVTSSSVSGADVTLGGVLGGMTQLNTDNLRLDANTLSTTNANGNLELDANGTGRTNIESAAAVTNNTGLRVAATLAVGFTNSGSLNGDIDTGMKRAAAGVYRFVTASGSSAADGWFNWSGQCRVTADQTNSTTTYASTTCTISNLTAGRKYPFRCWFSLNQATAADGAKFDFQGGTAGETSFIASLTIYDTALALSSHPDDLTDSSAATTLTGRGHAEVFGDFVPSSSGTFLPRFAQNAATTGTLTLHAGSWCTMDDSP